jgi:hypothetical protein
MNAFRTFALLSVAIPGLIGCSTSKPIRIPNPESYELKGDAYYLILTSEKVYKTDSLSVKRDSVYFNGKAVHIKQIKRIETRSFSPLKSVGLMAGIGSLAVVAGTAYLYYVFAYERSLDKK